MVTTVYRRIDELLTPTEDEKKPPEEIATEDNISNRQNENNPNYNNIGNNRPPTRSLPYVGTQPTTTTVPRTSVPVHPGNGTNQNVTPVTIKHPTGTVRPPTGSQPIIKPPGSGLEMQRRRLERFGKKCILLGS